MRQSLIDQTGHVVGRSDEADAYGWIPVEVGTVVAVRLGDFVAGADGVEGPPLVAPLTSQSFASPGAMLVTVTVTET